eukprot:s2457_g11.t1
MPLERCGVKLLQSFAEAQSLQGLQTQFPHTFHCRIAALLSAIYEKYFPHLEASALKAVDRFICEGERQKSDSFTSSIASKQLARQEMESQFGEIISDRL